MPKPSSNFVANVLKLVTGSLFAQGLGIMVTPILTRLFVPEAFGIAALFTSIAGIINVVVCLRYELSIMLPKTEEEAANLFFLSISFVFIIATISLLIIFLFADNIVLLLNSQELKKYLFFIPLSVFISGAFLAMNYWNSRKKYFGRLSIARIVSSTTTQATKLTAGFAGYVSGGGLIFSTIIGQFVSMSVLGCQIWRDDFRLFKERVRWKKMIVGFKRHKKFPIFSTWSALLNTGSQHLPTWILAFYFSPAVVGFYALGKLVLSTPMGLIGGAIAKVFYQRAADTNNRIGEMTNVVEEVFKRLISLGIFPILLLTFIGKDVFIIAFGAQWAEAGVYVQILSLWIFFQFISSPLSIIFGVLERQGSYLIFDIILFLGRLLSLICGGLTGDILITLSLFSMTSVLCYIFLSYWILLNAGVSLMHILFHLGKYALYCVPMMVVIALVKWALVLNPVFILLVGILSAIPYYAIILKREGILRSPVKALLNNSIKFFQP